MGGLGVAVEPWNFVRDDIESGMLVAPLGFIEDGSEYCLLFPEPLSADGPQSELLAWLREMASLSES